MPTGATHSFFWAGSADAPAPPAATDVIVGYVPWQTSVVIGSGFGVTQVVLEWLSGLVSTTRASKGQ